jgi:hypothetical protein
MVKSGDAQEKKLVSERLFLGGWVLQATQSSLLAVTRPGNGRGHVAFECSRFLSLWVSHGPHLFLLSTSNRRKNSLRGVDAASSRSGAVFPVCGKAFTAFYRR